MTKTRASKPESEDLTVGLQTRISSQAERLLHERARRSGVRPATWVRITIYRALGLLEAK